MKESVGYTVTLNIAITFIIIVFAFLSAAIIYFKSNKVSNIIMNSIEKYEGYNKPAVDDIKRKMDSLGYSSRDVKCSSVLETKKEACLLQMSTNSSSLNSVDESIGAFLAYLSTIMSFTVDVDTAVSNLQVKDTSKYNTDGYCVYMCLDRNKEINLNEGFDIYYKVRTNMMMNVPIINNILDIPIYSNTNTIHVFKENF